jgi:hypothetical protein
VHPRVLRRASCGRAATSSPPCTPAAAGPRQLHRPTHLAPRVFRKDLGQPVIEGRSGLEDGGGYPIHFVRQAVAAEAASDHGVVVEPDRAVVVGVRVVAPFAPGHHRDPQPLKSSSLISRSATERASPRGRCRSRGGVRRRRLENRPGARPRRGRGRSKLNPPSRSLGRSVL